MNRHSSHKLLLAGLLSTLLAPVNSLALTIADSPLFLTGSVTPLVMLNISKDHQLSYKAYNDYADLDGDGTAETTYKDSIDYYGYFDSKKCYTYSTANNRFVPAAMATGANNHYCSGQWSGNFLNWASMTRMDAVRKLLYGGQRSDDSATLTVLERHYLPTDAHAFAKYYNGSDIASLTPFSSISTTPPTATSSTSRTIPNHTTGTADRTFTTTLSVSLGDQVKVFVTGNEATQWMIGGVTSTGTGTITIQIPGNSFGGSGVTSTNWTLKNLSQTGISFCNLTKGDTTGANRYSHSNTNPPLIRVASGNFALWNANERWQCYWSGEKSNTQSGFTGGFRSNGNKAFLSGLNASGENPSQTTHGLGSGVAQGEYVARVEACNSTLLGQERCKQYGTSYKPIGLLQVYGDSDQLHFGLLTGTFVKNISGGVLRKNASSFSNEVNSANGTFVSGANGIVHNMNKMRLYGYDYNDGTYIGADSCNYQQTGLVLSGGSTTQGQPANQGNCSSWGNPMSEIYLESLRYLAGKSATSAFTYSGASKDATLGLTVATWSDPLNNLNFCAPLNVLNFNASVSGYDGDQMGGISDLGATSSAAALTDAVGTHDPDIADPMKTWFIGSNGGVAPNNLCTSKSNSYGFGAFAGLCPEAPTQKGTYLMAGVAHYARTNAIRSDLTVPTGSQFANSLKVNTYGIALATNVPRIEVPIGTGKVTILPAYRLTVSGNVGGGSLVDFKIIQQTPTYGKFYVNWEDSEMGGDYDQDMWGTIEYSVSGNTITITTNAVSAATANGQGFGYVISGTDRDGAHFHSGIYNFNYTDPTGVTGCNNCVVDNAPTSWTYTATGTSAGLLNDPLWYTAKYGGFSDVNNNGWPDAGEYDVLNNATGLPGGDGVPDNFFHVTNPLVLEKALNAAFLKILKDSSASAVATNSSTLNTGSRIFQGRFSNSSWSGQLLSYRLDTSGSVLSATTPPPAWDPAETPYPEWDAGQKIKGQASTSSDSRLILTRGNSGGASFEYANLSAGQQALLNQDWLLNTDNCGPERINFLRGWSVHEGVGTFTCASTNTIQRFRTRSVSILGDIINSNPAFVGPPSAGYSNVDHPGYNEFRTKFKDRLPVVYVGANDGMLHGFDVSVDTATNLPTSDAGKEVIAYVPSQVYANLSRLTDNNYSANHKYFVDSSPMMADACISTTSLCSTDWKTVLIGGLGAGGRGYYALNITNPKDTSEDTAATPEFKVSNAANILLWEFTHLDHADLGYTFNNAPTNINTGQSRQIVKFQNGRWGVVIGNGYNGGNGGKAVLFVIFLSGPSNSGNWVLGTDYIRIEANAGPNNGLSTPITFDANGDGLIDTVYAGDLTGKMWKFDLSNANPANWGVAFSGSPLFTADHSGTPQPITTPPEVTLHPSGGMMVLFGTGKFLESTDNTSTATQTFYGIHDNGATVAKASLTPITVSTTTIGGVTFRTTEAGCYDPANPPNPLPNPLPPVCPIPAAGWYANLPSSGERHTGSPRIIASTVFFNTFIPSISPCEFGGTGWLMGLQYTDGQMLPFAAFDTNASGTVDASDAPVAGVQVGAALGGTTLIKSMPGGNASVGISSLTTGDTAATPMSFGAGFQGRINWREIIQ